MSQSTHLVLIPSYNTGPRLVATVHEALERWEHVWVVVDGSTDGSDHALDYFSKASPNFRVLRLPRNSGKGAAVLAGAEEAKSAGYSHALVMDADGQHPASQIVEFMESSRANPKALILGKPVFGSDAPTIRLQGRKISVALVHFEIFGAGINDPLFGFRVYPLAPLIKIMSRNSFARRYDFDPEMAVRLVWSGRPTVNIPANCRYISLHDGGVSHFHYIRDNLRMVWLHTRLITELLLWRWPSVYRNRHASK